MNRVSEEHLGMYKMSDAVRLAHDILISTIKPFCFMRLPTAGALYLTLKTDVESIESTAL